MMQPEKEFEVFWEKERLEWPASMAENPMLKDAVYAGWKKCKETQEIALQTILDQIPNNDELLIRRIWDKVRLVYLNNGMSVDVPADTKRLNWLLEHMKKQLWHTVFHEYQHCKNLREAIDAAIKDGEYV